LDGKDCWDTDGFGFGCAADLNKERMRTELGWAPLKDDTDDVRLFVVVRDAGGGQTWQEIRPIDP